jgi:hypothetical protein
MTAIPEAYVTAHLAGGPHDGETLQMPWARVEVPMVRWEDNQMVESLYRLSAPWRGQATAEYRFVEPRIEEQAA